MRVKRPSGPLTPEWLRSQTVEDSNGCWIWQRSLSPDGYGRIWYNGANKAHRVMYILTHPKFDHSLWVRHDCDVPACINPDHLRAGTPKQNVGDCISRGRLSNRKGKRNGRAKLTPQQVKKIRKDPRSLSQIARDYGIGKTQASRIKRGEHWQHV